jgi:hypothetical protein
MAADHNPVADRPEAQSKGNLPKRPSGFALLARRISSWTSKGILTGIVLVAGLVFGRQVLYWWGEDQVSIEPPSQTAAALDALGDETVEHILQFGDQPWSMHRQVITGDVKAAVAVLRKTCRRVTPSGGVSEGPPGRQEQALLKSLTRREPVEQAAGKWAVYQLDDAVPMVVGVRQIPAASRLSGGGNVVGNDLRVVSWGFGVPAESRAWTLYTFVSAPPTSGGGERGPAVPLPPGCTRTMSMRVAGGGGIVAFGGPRLPDAWMAFYDGYFRKRGWKPDGRWQKRGDRWSGRFCEGPAPNAGAVDVQFGPDDRGGMTGLLMITAGAVQPKEGSSR